MSGDNFSRQYSVVAETRRQWSTEEKQTIVAEAARPGANVSAVARRHGIKPSLLFRWRRRARETEVARTAGPVFLPVAVAATITSGETPARDAAPDKTSPSTPSEAACCSADSRIEIELENGRRVRFGAGVDTEALKRILDLVDRR